MTAAVGPGLVRPNEVVADERPPAAGILVGAFHHESVSRPHHEDVTVTERLPRAIHQDRGAVRHRRLHGLPAHIENDGPIRMNPDLVEPVAPKRQTVLSPVAADLAFRSRRSGRLAYERVRLIRHDGGPASYEGVAHRQCPEQRATSMMGATCRTRLRGLALLHAAAAAPPHARSRSAHAAGRCARTGAAPGARRRVVVPMRFRCDGASAATPGTHRGRRRWPNPPVSRAPDTRRGR